MEESPAERSIEGFSARKIADDVVLVKYQAIRREGSGENVRTLRSSIWKKILANGRWYSIRAQLLGDERRHLAKDAMLAEPPRKVVFAKFAGG